MSFTPTGDCQLVSQIYTYKGNRIACSYKVLPTPVMYFEREATNKYHWMTDARWTRIESALWRLFENLNQWQDAKKLRAELLVDHINVRVQATEKPHPASQSLLAGAELAPKDLSLDIQLQYMTSEDTTIVDMHTTKRKLATEADANGTAESRSSSIKGKRGSGKKRKAGLPEKPSPSKPKHIDADDEEDDVRPATLGSQSPIKVKRDRRSISQDGGMQSSLSNGRTSQGEEVTDSSSLKSSRARSAENKVARRSGRSPIRTSRYNNYVLGKTQRKKRQSDIEKSPKSKENALKGKPETPAPIKKVKGQPATLSADKAVKEKSLTPAPADTLKVEQMDVARLDALQHLDSILAVTKPTEVQILLLGNMGEADVLASFENYKSHFDKLFKERKNKMQTLSYMSVSHMDVMDILSVSIRHKMIKKLGECYSTKSNHTSLLINGLLPLWIVLLFKDTYKLSHDDAVRQIKDQLKWSSYQKALNNEPLSSDLEN